jgi:hypothetical protein
MDEEEREDEETSPRWGWAARSSSAPSHGVWRWGLGVSSLRIISSKATIHSHLLPYHYITLHTIYPHSLITNTTDNTTPRVRRRKREIGRWSAWTVREGYIDRALFLAALCFFLR